MFSERSRPSCDRRAEADSGLVVLVSSPTMNRPAFSDGAGVEISGADIAYGSQIGRRNRVRSPRGFGAPRVVPEYVPSATCGTTGR